MLANVVSLAADRSLTDDTVIHRVLKGKTEDYEILVRRYNTQLYKTARGILLDEADIEDAMQEAYLRAFENLHQFRSEARFSTWLTRILINCALKQVNKLRGKNQISMDLIDPEDLREFEETTDSAKVDSDVSQNLKKALEAAINHIPPKYRLVFVLREIEQTPTHEVAIILGITEENVKIRLHRAKNMLKEILRTKLDALDIFVFHATRCALMGERVMGQIKPIKQTFGRFIVPKPIDAGDLH